MTTKVSTTPVLLDELIVMCGGSREAVDTWLKKFRVTPTTDWAGRSVIPADAAMRVMQAYRQNAAENAAAVSEYDQYVKDRTRRLVAAGDQAYSEAADRELRKQYETPFAQGKDGMGWASVTYTNALTLWPQGRQIAREAALKAREEFEKKEPLLRFGEWQKRRK